MSENYVYPTIKFVAYESRHIDLIFVPDPSLRGRYILTHWCVGAVPCPFCKAIPGEPCKHMGRYNVATHADRRKAARKLRRTVKPDDCDKQHICYDKEAI